MGDMSIALDKYFARVSQRLGHGVATGFFLDDQRIGVSVRFPGLDFSYSLTVQRGKDIVKEIVREFVDQLFSDLELAADFFDYFRRIDGLPKLLEAQFPDGVVVVLDRMTAWPMTTRDLWEAVRQIAEKQRRMIDQRHLGIRVEYWVNNPESVRCQLEFAEGLIAFDTSTPNQALTTTALLHSVSYRMVQVDCQFQRTANTLLQEAACLDALDQGGFGV